MANRTCWWISSPSEIRSGSCAAAGFLIRLSMARSSGGRLAGRPAGRALHQPEVCATTLFHLTGDATHRGAPSAARQLMGYSGAVASEHSSGPRVRRGGITKTGNAHLGRIVVEAAWSYRHRPRVGYALRQRQGRQSEAVRAIAWKAQHRLHRPTTSRTRAASPRQLPTDHDHAARSARSANIRVINRRRRSFGRRSPDTMSPADGYRIV